MKYYDGSLSDLLYSKDEKGNNLVFFNHLSNELKSDILIGILNGLKFLHKNDFVHLDLKPSNILISKQNENQSNKKYIPKISDFGLSKFIEKDRNSIFKIDEVGTLDYASPEQLKLWVNYSRLQPQDAKKNTDLWSFGVIAYETFTGELPFDGCWLEGKNIPEKIKEIPEPWQKLIRLCLEPDFDKRIKTAKDCLDIILVPELKQPPKPQTIDVLIDDSYVNSTNDKLPNKEKIVKLLQDRLDSGVSDAIKNKYKIMEQNVKDKDVLLVKDENSNELYAATKNKKGEMIGVKPDNADNPDLIKFDRHGNMLENFFQNFKLQVKTNEATKNIKEPMKQGQTQPTKKQAEKQKVKKNKGIKM